jgi:DNA-binding response OmpR family regulator
MTARILVIEDDADIALGVRTVLTRSGFDVATAADGRAGLRDFHTGRPDLIVLDIGLPALDGWAVLERIRDMSDLPVLLLTGHGQESDKVRGLYGGADDYLTKPFGNRELAARVHALLRRRRTGRPQSDVYDDGSVLVKFGSHEVSVDGVPVELTPTEFRLLAALVWHSGQTLSAEQLLELAWNDPFGVGPDRVKFGIMRLRRKLRQRAAAASPIEVVRGFGYRYMAPSADLPPPHGMATILHRDGNGFSRGKAARWGDGHHRSGPIPRADPGGRGRSRGRLVRCPRPHRDGPVRRHSHL